MRALTIAAVAAAGIAGCSGDGSSKKSPADSVEVSVVAVGSLESVAGARVVVHDAAGEPLAVLVTGTNGVTVIEDPEEGTMITVVTTAGGDAWMRTVIGVEPGDELVVPIPDGAPVAAPSPAATPDYVFTSGYAGAYGYALELGCSVSFVFATDGSASVGPECVAIDDQTYDAVVIAGDSGADALAFTSLEDIPVSQPALAFPAWRTDFTEHTLEVTTAPPDVVDLFGSVLTRAESGVFGTADTAVNSTGGTGTFLIRLVPEPAVGTLTGLDLAYATGNTFDGRALHFVGAVGLATSQSLDLASAVLPRTSAAAFTTSAGGSAISWTTSAAVTGDVLQVTNEWAGADFRGWILYAPAETISPLRLPTLPPEMAVLVPTTAPGTVRIRFFEADFINGYPAFRNEFLSWPPTGAINLTSTSALQAVPLDQVPQSFVLKISEADL